MYPDLLDGMPKDFSPSVPPAIIALGSGISPYLCLNCAQMRSYIGMEICWPIMLRTRDVWRSGSASNPIGPTVPMSAFIFLSDEMR